MNERMPDEFWQGVEQFNAGQYYACHDTLEALWIEAAEPEKTFYQGILQIAVALYHLSNNNLRGAMILLGEGSNRLRRYPPEYGGIDMDQILSQSAALLITLQQTDPQKIAALNLGQDEALPLPRIIQVTYKE